MGWGERLTGGGVNVVQIFEKWETVVAFLPFVLSSIRSGPFHGLNWAFGSIAYFGGLSCIVSLGQSTTTPWCVRKSIPSSSVQLKLGQKMRYATSSSSPKPIRNQWLAFVWLVQLSTDCSVMDNASRGISSHLRVGKADMLTREHAAPVSIKGLIFYPWNCPCPTRCNPPGIKIDILVKRCVVCHLKAWTLLIIVAKKTHSLIRLIGNK